MSRKLLILSICPSVLEMYATFFYSRGFQIFTATTNMEASEVITREKIDCVFLETRLLDGSTEPFYQAYLVPASNVAVVFALYYSEVPPNYVELLDAYTVVLPAKLDQVLVTIREAIESAKLSIVPIHVQPPVPEAVA